MSVPLGSGPAPVPYVPDLGLLRAVMVDVDGTLALNTSGRSPYDMARVGEDEPNEPVAELVRDLSQIGYSIVLCSGRDESARDATLGWLARHRIPFDALHMRAVGDTRKDSVVKLELFEEIRGRWNVRFVLDDRNQVVKAWRSIGLPVFQVADGDF